ncbi:DUF6151 family protein [Rhodobacteraceae bacterium D3-12]|nr:DUF6151 family protein [Rhodobacteraceae bacterium D3-12]
MTDIPFSCTCGTVQGYVSVPSAKSGNRVTCHCADCRAAMIHLNQPDPAPDGIDIWQTLPEHVHFTAGTDHLSAMRLSPRGMFRWYADCCNTPITSTLRGPRLNVGGFIAARLSDTSALPPRGAYVFKKQANGKYRHKGMGHLAWRVAQLMLSANLSGSWRENPFFDDTGKPIRTPRTLTREERKAATP